MEATATDNDCILIAEETTNHLPPNPLVTRLAEDTKLAIEDSRRLIEYGWRLIAASKQMQAVSRDLIAESRSLLNRTTSDDMTAASITTD